MEDFSKRIAARHRIRALGHCGGGVRQPWQRTGDLLSVYRAVHNLARMRYTIGRISNVAH